MGRHKIYESAEELQKVIDEYFNSITITKPRTISVIVGYEGEEKEIPIYEERPLLNNNGEQVYESSYFENPSIIKMAHYVGMTRETLNQYSKNETFSDTIKAAKEKVEAYLENELYRHQGQVAGVIFNLKNNFGWKDKSEVDQFNWNVNNNINHDATEGETKATLNSIIEKLQNK